MTINLSSLFSNIPNEFTLPSGESPGRFKANFDLLAQKFAKNQNIKDSKFQDFARLEDDPNYSREENQDLLSIALGKLSMATQLSSITNNQLSLFSIQEYVPSNISSILNNFNSLIDTNLDLSSEFQQNNPAKQFGSALSNDLLLQFRNGNLPLNNILLMANNFKTNFIDRDIASNNAIRSLLSLGLENFLPRPISEVLSSLQYVDLLLDIIPDEDERDTFNSALEARLTAYGKTKLSTIVDPANYSNLKITLDDSLGLQSRSNFNSEITEDYSEEITSIIETIGEDLSADEKEEIEILLQEDAADNIDQALSGTIGLPSLHAVARGVVALVSNNSDISIKQAFDATLFEVVSPLGINAPVDLEYSDYLFNLKRNLESRNKMKLNGASIDALVLIDNELSKVFPKGRFSEVEFERLVDQLNTLMRDAEAING